MLYGVLLVGVVVVCGNGSSIDDLVAPNSSSVLSFTQITTQTNTAATSATPSRVIRHQLPGSLLSRHLNKPYTQTQATKYIHTSYVKLNKIILYF